MELKRRKKPDWKPIYFILIKASQDYCKARMYAEAEQYASAAFSVAVLCDVKLWFYAMFADDCTTIARASKEDASYQAHKMRKPFIGWHSG